MISRGAILDKNKNKKQGEGKKKKRTISRQGSMNSEFQNNKRETPEAVNGNQGVISLVITGNLSHTNNHTTRSKYASLIIVDPWPPRLFMWHQVKLHDKKFKRQGDTISFWIIRYCYL